MHSTSVDDRYISPVILRILGRKPVTQRTPTMSAHRDNKEPSKRKRDEQSVGGKNTHKPQPKESGSWWPFGGSAQSNTPTPIHQSKTTSPNKKDDMKRQQLTNKNGSWWPFGKKNNEHSPTKKDQPKPRDKKEHVVQQTNGSNMTIGHQQPKTQDRKDKPETHSTKKNDQPDPQSSTKHSGNHAKIGHPKAQTKSNNPQVQSPKKNDKPRSQSPKKNDKPQSQSPKKNDKPRSQSPKKNGKPQSQSPKKNDKPRSQSPKKNAKPQSQSPKRNDKHQAESSKKHEKYQTQSSSKPIVQKTSGDHMKTNSVSNQTTKPVHGVYQPQSPTKYVVQQGPRVTTPSQKSPTMGWANPPMITHTVEGIPQKMDKKEKWASVSNYSSGETNSNSSEGMSLYEARGGRGTHRSDLTEKIKQIFRRWKEKVRHQRRN
jgi:hypothetical protein